jgi:hypothetical protein
MLIRANMQLMGIDEVDKALSIDSRTLSTNCEKFIKVNRLEYYVACNTWLHIIKQYSQYGWMGVSHRITKQGLVATIKAANDSATQLINGDVITDGVFSSIYRDIQTPHYGWGFPKSDKEVGNDPDATALQVFRYLKRLSPLENDVIETESIKDFIATENRSKLLQRRERPLYLMQWLRKTADEYLDWDALCQELEGMDETSYTFTTGFGFDATSSIGSKLRALLNEAPEMLPNPLGIPYIGSRVTKEIRNWNGNISDIVRPVKVSAVPKSYKAARIIAMEETVRQSKARWVGNIIDKYLPQSVPLHDQTVNQDLAWIGSVDGSVATLDQSHASDCITKTLFWEIFPQRFCNIVYPLLGTHTVIDGKYRLMQQMSTAGNALTFILECMVFDIIARTAVNILESWGVPVTKSLQVKDRVLLLPSAYGDDLAVATEAAELTIEILESLGFIINEDKSYTSGAYRESCGAEFLLGVDVSSYYFPRFPIEGRVSESKVSLSPKISRDSWRDVYVDSLTSLIDLQHRLHFVCYPASRFIFELVKEAKPSMTVSPAGSVSSDLWDYDEEFKLAFPPAARIKVSQPTVTYRDSVTKKQQVITLRWAPLVRKFIKEELPDIGVDLSRRMRLAPKVQYKCDKISDFDRRAYNTYKYWNFLRKGPSFSDPLLELLGVSDRPVPIEQAYGTPQMVWTLTEEF